MGRRYYLLGDEDAGVGIHCRDCDTGGIPVAYYGTSYPDPAIVVTQSIEALLSAARQHDAEHPAEGLMEPEEEVSFTDEHFDETLVGWEGWG